MLDHTSLSRTERYNKRRNNKRKLFFFIVLAMFFFVILLSLIAFGNKDEPEDTQTITEDESAEKENSEQKTIGSDASTSLETEIEHHESSGIDGISDIDDIEVEQVDPTGENVIEAYTADWPPSGTIQEGPHTTDYSNGSQDRIEIKRAVSYVTGIPEDDMIEWHVGNGGEQKVIATVSNKAQNEYYRVYLDWIDGEGWKPTLNERITGYQK